MDPITIAAWALLAGASVSVGLTIRGEVRRRHHDRKLTEMVELANDAITNEISRINRMRPRVEMQEVDPESELGQAIIRTLGLDGPCGCPNCGEERRIQHVEQKRDER
ncbi:hypothetical protein [Leucobacter sp. GX24907]